MGADGGRGAGDRLGAGHVELDRGRSPSGSLDLLGGSRSRFGLAAAEEHVVTEPGELAGHCSADAPIRSRDQGRGGDHFQVLSSGVGATDSLPSGRA